MTQMLLVARQCFMTLTQGHSSKFKFMAELHENVMSWYFRSVMNTVTVKNFDIWPFYQFRQVHHDLVPKIMIQCQGHSMHQALTNRYSYDLSDLAFHLSIINYILKFGPESHMTKGLCLPGYGRCAAVHGKSLSEP